MAEKQPSISRHQAGLKFPSHPHPVLISSVIMLIIPQEGSIMTAYLSVTWSDAVTLYSLPSPITASYRGPWVVSIPRGRERGPPASKSKWGQGVLPTTGRQSEASRRVG